MTKKIVKRTDANNETLYFYTHSDAVDVGEGNNTTSLTAALNSKASASDLQALSDDALRKSPQSLSSQEKAQVHNNLSTESFIDDRAVRYDDAQVLGSEEKTQALTNLGLNGVDDEPTPNSDNLVKSGGVKNELVLGAVYDVSAKNPTAGPNNDGKFESLSALLSDANLITLIPTAVRKGGMSIKFVQTSDNNYVQFRYMSSSTATADFSNVANWQGVDETPTAGSQNLVTSGGVKNKLVPLDAEINGGILLSPYYNGYISSGGNWVSNNNYRFYILQTTPGESLTIVANSANKSHFALLESFSGFNPGTLAPENLGFVYDANSTNTLQVESNYHYLLIYTKFVVGGSSIDNTPYSVKRGNTELFNAIGINEEILNIKTELSTKASKLLNGDGNLAMIDEFGAYKDSEINALKCKDAINTIDGSERKERDILDALQIASGHYYTSSSTTPAGSGSANKYSTANVDISQYDSIDIIAQSYSSAGSDTRACLIVDESNNILEAQTWVGIVQTPTDKVLHFDLKALPGAKYVLVSYTSNNCPNGISVLAINDAKASFEERLQSLENGDIENVYEPHFIHISFDDVNTPFAWLAANYSSVSSIFSESLFALLRQLHNEYGAVFTLNCFMEGLSALATAGNKFASEFVKNSDWLKFAFHAYAGGVTYDQSKTSHTYRDAADDYAAFVDAIIAVTGSVRNIDQVSRLGYYEGGEADLLKFRNAKMGIYGFLCSDAISRDSYYLDTDISKLVYANGCWYDAKNQMFFVSTNVPRLDVSEDVTQESAMTFVTNNVGSGKKYIEAFMHETTIYSNTETDTLYQSRGNLILDALCDYSKQHSYFPGFSQKYLFIM